MRNKRAKQLRKLAYSISKGLADRRMIDPKTGQIFHVGPRRLYKSFKMQYKKGGFAHARV